MNAKENEDDDDYNGKDSNHDDEVKVDCENQKLLWYVVGSPKVLTFYTSVPSIRGDWLHRTIRDDDFQCNTRPTIE